MPRKRGKQTVQDIATRNFASGCERLGRHPMFAPLMAHANIIRREGNLCPQNGWAVVTTNGYIHVHPARRAEPEEWIYVLAHCLLHLGFGHLQKKKEQWLWNTACDCYVAKFLADLKLGRAPGEIGRRDFAGKPTEEELYEAFCERGVPEDMAGCGTAGTGNADMLLGKEHLDRSGKGFNWRDCFGLGLAAAVSSAVKVAAGVETALDAVNSLQSSPQRARAWFMSSYPLLGALAAAFPLIEDPLICNRLGIMVAAVDAIAKEIFINPSAGLDEYESRFVMAHELLHVGLGHQARCHGRDPYLWNVACDYVINGWLVEMGLGELPKIGVLHDPVLKGLSAESVYDRIVIDMRRYRKLATLRGIGLGDMLERGKQGSWGEGDGIRLDDFYRRCLAQGLAYHEEGGRGLLPAGLIEEIRALCHPPVPWDVELAQWFDDHISPLVKIRTYARPSRRQAAVPDIPRPSWTPAFGAEDGRTFGVVLDTSGSMDRGLLAKALGAIASYAAARDVRLVRVVFCDAAAYDQGYLPPEAIGDRVRVKGRGGTVLQPGIDLLEQAGDFPKDGPLLVITDGFCDHLHIRREHAFLIPQGRHLPFVPKGKIFRLS